MSLTTLVKPSEVQMFPQSGQQHHCSSVWDPCLPTALCWVLAPSLRGHPSRKSVPRTSSGKTHCSKDFWDPFLFPSLFFFSNLDLL